MAVNDSFIVEPKVGFKEDISIVGHIVNNRDGPKVGDRVGFKVGSVVLLVGFIVDTKEGFKVSNWVGFKVGSIVILVGLVVDSREGFKVGN